MSITFTTGTCTIPLSGGSGDNSTDGGSSSSSGASASSGSSSSGWNPAMLQAGNATQLLTQNWILLGNHR